MESYVSACEYKFYLLVLIKFVSLCGHVISSLSVHHRRSLRKIMMWNQSNQILVWLLLLC